MSRFWTLAGTGTRAATKLAGHRVKRAFGAGSDADGDAVYTAIGEEIARALGDLKGPVMKLGQVAAQMHDVLPPQIAEALKPLQREAPPAPWECIARQIEDELGGPPEQVFAQIDHVPMAAASIGQVHRARTHDGEDVVVKVQYPGVDKALDSDLTTVRRLIRVGRLARVPAETLDAVFAELRDRLSEELDYRIEAGNLRHFAALYADEPSLCVPEVRPQLSSRRVLTLTYEPGDAIEDTAAYSPAVRAALSERLFTLIADQIFVHHALHADPHPGNFAFRPDGTVVVYDFGSVKHLDPATVAAYRRALRAGLDADWPALDAAMIDVGLRRPKAEPPPDAYYAAWRELLTQPLGLDGPVDFSTLTTHRQLARQSRESLRYVGRFQPAAELMMIDRVVVGHYWNLIALGARVSFAEGVERYLGEV